MDPGFFVLRQLAAVFFALPVLSGFASPLAAEEGKAQAPTHIFFSAGCADCWPYVEDILIPALQARGVAGDPRIHDYTAPDDRKLLLEVADSVELPRSVADSWSSARSTSSSYSTIKSSFGSAYPRGASPRA